MQVICTHIHVAVLITDTGLTCAGNSAINTIRVLALCMLHVCTVRMWAINLNMVSTLTPFSGDLVTLFSKWPVLVASSSWSTRTSLQLQLMKWRKCLLKNLEDWISIPESTMRGTYLRLSQRSQQTASLQKHLRRWWTGLVSCRNTLAKVQSTIPHINTYTYISVRNESNSTQSRLCVIIYISGMQCNKSMQRVCPVITYVELSYTVLHMYRYVLMAKHDLLPVPVPLYSDAMGEVIVRFSTIWAILQHPTDT